MKKTYIILIILIITSTIGITGQEPNTKPSKIWSVSLSHAPIYTFYFYHLKNEFIEYFSKGITEVKYQKGTNLRVDYKLSNRLSISSGINFKTRETARKDMGADISYFETSTETKYLFEIPLGINYQLINSPKYFDPYLKTGLRNSYFKRRYVGEYIKYQGQNIINGTIDNHDGKYIVFYELGAGTYVNLIKSVSLMFESNVTYTISGFGYLELQGGLRFSFK